MITQAERVELTPAQCDFCSRHIAGFDVDRWIITIAGKAGSDRCFLRVTSPVDKNFTRILVLWDSRDQDWPRFLAIHDEVNTGLSLLPQIYAFDPAPGLILEEDCGSFTLKDFCHSGVKSSAVLSQYKKVIDTLILWQGLSPHNRPMLCSRTLDKEVFLWETDYFAQHCVREYFGLESMLNRQWLDERMRLAHNAAVLPLVILHRDFQSENVMIHDGTIKFVDYQGARLGAAEYDLASLLFDPYVASSLTGTIRSELLEYYRGAGGYAVTAATFLTAATQRLCQALGAYGNLSLHKGKDSYRTFIPDALSLLHQVLTSSREYPILLHIIEECINRAQNFHKSE